MSAPCYILIETYGEDGYPNGCENDSTGTMNCKDCISWCGGYTCPSNDETYYYRVDKGLDVGNYKPDMTREETEKWFDEYNRKYGFIR